MCDMVPNATRSVPFVSSTGMRRSPEPASDDNATHSIVASPLRLLFANAALFGLASTPYFAFGVLCEVACIYPDMNANIQCGPTRVDIAMDNVDFAFRRNVQEILSVLQLLPKRWSSTATQSGNEPQ